MSDEMREIVDQLRQLNDKMSGPPPRKDIWEKLPIVASFLSTVVLAALATALGIYFQRVEANRAAAFEQTQLELKRAEIRIEELKALTSIAPMLADKDTAVRRVGNQVMEAVSAQGNTVFEKSSNPAPTTSNKTTPKSPSKPVYNSLLDQFAAVIFKATAPTPERVRAMESVGEIAANPSATQVERERAVQIATDAARAPNIPAEVARTASEVLERVKRISLTDAITAIQRDTSTRVVDEIILHHTATPAAGYNGARSVVRLAEFLVNDMSWSQVAWHYAVAPDGSIWLGTPLGTAAIHTVGRQKTSVSVMLIMNGDKELPTDAQRAAVGAVLRALLERYRIAPDVNFTAGRGLHREHTRNKSCPGSLITHQLALEWIAAAT